MIKFINKTESVKAETLNSLIYGEPGIGKTSLAFTSEKPLLIDFDGGLQRACYRLDSVRVETWEDVIELQKSKELIELQPKTLIIDTVGAMLDNYIADYVKKIDPKNARRGGELSLQGYGAMKNVFKQFMDWAKSSKINLIFIAHHTEQIEGDNIKFIPKVTGGSADILRQTMDLIGYIESYQNKRVISFTPTDRHIGKDCAQIGRLEIPEYQKTEYSEFFESLINKTLDSMNNLSKNQAEIIEKIKEYKKKVDNIGTSKDANIEISVLSEEKNKTLQVQYFHILKEKCESIGIKYNSDKKTFEDVSIEA